MLNEPAILSHDFYIDLIIGFKDYKYLFKLCCYLIYLTSKCSWHT